MEMCFIAPTPLLKDFATKSSTHLILAHIYAEDEEYRKFYQERIQAGDFVILDNSAYELGSSYGLGKLLSIASTLQPAAMFLPDVRFDYRETLQQVDTALVFIKQTTGIKSALYAVPQGNNQTEILYCYDRLLRIPEVAGIGLYEEIGKVAGLKNREEFLCLLEETGRIKKGIYYHLLGMEDQPADIQQLAKHEWVNSIDSVKPIAYGLYGIAFDAEKGSLVEYPHRQKDYFTRDAGWFHEIIDLNCELTHKWANSSRHKYIAQNLSLGN